MAGESRLTVTADCVEVRSIGVRSEVVWESDFDLDLEPESDGGGVDVDGAEESLGQMTDGRFALLPEGRSASFVVTASTDAWVSESCLPDGGEGGWGH